MFQHPQFSHGKAIELDQHKKIDSRKIVSWSKVSVFFLVSKKNVVIAKSQQPTIRSRLCIIVLTKQLNFGI